MRRRTELMFQVVTVRGMPMFVMPGLVPGIHVLRAASI
jgi:hypothetical protein